MRLSLSLIHISTEMLRSGVSFPVLMKLLGHVNPEMTMRYVDVALTDLQREFQLARAKPRHLAPQPKPSSSKLRAGFKDVYKRQGAHSPIQVVEQPAGRGVGWINRFLDREYVRRLADKSLYSYAHSLLHFVRWWESVHHTGEISRACLLYTSL